MDELELKLKELLKDSVPEMDHVDEIKSDDLLAEYDLNSVSYIQWILAIEKEFDFEFDDEYLRMEKFPTLQDLVKYTEERCATK